MLTHTGFSLHDNIIITRYLRTIGVGCQIHNIGRFGGCYRDAVFYSIPDTNVLITARKRSVVKVIFLHLCVILFTGEGVCIQG